MRMYEKIKTLKDKLQKMKSNRANRQTGQTFHFSPFSRKQKQVLTWWCKESPVHDMDGVIADGAIRSGKTISMSLSFVMWAMSTFAGQNFAMCGKTIGSFRRNVLFWLKLMLRSRGYSITDHRADNLLTIRKDGKENYFYIFGGKDERSQDLIQGITLAGVFFDEVALMPESFVNQATGRCSVKGSKFWFNCNPDGPYHWFKQNWIDKSTGYLGKEETARRMQQAAAEGKDPGLKNILYLHFTMDDNLSLDEEIKARYRSMYVGVFFKRYIMGLWAAAEGIIYDMFDENKHVQDIKDFYQLLINGNRYVSCDYGTQNATVFLLWNKGTNGKWYCIREYYYSGRDKGKQKTDSEYADDLKEWLDGTKIKAIIVDPSAASFIAELRKRGYKVLKANNDVLDGIRLVGMLLNLEKIVFASSCKETIKEFASYIWDEKALERGEDKPVKQWDHCLTGDTLIDTVKGKIPIEKLVGKKGKVYCYDVKRRKRAISTFYNVRKTRKNADIYKITLEDGNSIKMTADHLVYTQRGWVALKHLKATDKILKVKAGHEWHKMHYEKMKEKLHQVHKFNCLMCGKEFQSPQTESKFCCNNCKSAYRRKIGVDNITKICSFCGGEYTANKYSKTKFCPICRNKKYRKNRQS